jgi:hypothetical protein
MSMPKGARPHFYAGLALSVVSVLLVFVGGGPVSIVLAYAGAFLLLVAAIAWGVSIGLDGHRRDGTGPTST